MSALRERARRQGRKRSVRLVVRIGARIGWDGQVLRITAANSFFLDWIRLNFRAAIEFAGKSVLGRSPDVQFVVAEEQGDNKEEPCGGRCDEQTARRVEGSRAADSGVGKMVSLNGHSKRNREVATAGDAASRPGQGAVTAVSVPAVPYAPRKFASLTSFVAGPCNKLALYSAEMVARDPGKITPLFVHGPTSVGKTHLLEGIWSADARRAGAQRASTFPLNSLPASSLRRFAAADCPFFAASIAASAYCSWTTCTF